MKINVVKTKKRKTFIQKGDLVSIVPGAIYVTGASVPQWIRMQKWVVTEELDGEFVRLDRNELGAPYNSDPISKKYLVLINPKAYE